MIKLILVTVHGFHQNFPVHTTYWTIDLIVTVRQRRFEAKKSLRIYDELPQKPAPLYRSFILPRHENSD